jgi:hypothetical protein
MAVVGCAGLITRPNVDDAIDGTKLDLLTCCQHEPAGTVALTIKARAEIYAMRAAVDGCRFIIQV